MRTKKLSAKSPQHSKANHSPLGKAIIQGMKELQSHMRGEIQLRTRVVYVPENDDVHAIREKSGLSQTQFAERYGFSPRTLQDWEQGRRTPDSAVRAYLTVIDRDPAAVEKALRS
jgi:putative transcriptional regulator